MRQTKIIATVGPNTVDQKSLKKLLEAGVNIFRINLSHGSREWHQQAIDNICAVSGVVDILLDTRGPEIRTGDFDGEVEIKEGEVFYLVTKKEDQNPEKKKFFTAYSKITETLQVGEKVAIDGGMLFAEVVKVGADFVQCKAENSWTISSRRHINLPGERVDLPTLTEQDISDLKVFANNERIKYIAMSFVRSANDIKKCRKICPKQKIIAKIENQEGVNNFPLILKEADGVMVARGDLGVEVPLEALPVIQRRMVRAIRDNDKFVIVATEMLESMVQKPRPTRAEVSDIATAVWEGASAVMLSQETAMGAYPVRAVEIMRKTIEFTEND